MVEPTPETGVAPQLHRPSTAVEPVAAVAPSDGVHLAVAAGDTGSAGPPHPPAFCVGAQHDWVLQLEQHVMHGKLASTWAACSHAGGCSTDDTRRRAISLSWCLGWLRAVENTWLTLPLDLVAGLPSRARELPGCEICDGSADEVRSGFPGCHEMGSPRVECRGGITTAL